MFWKSYSKKIYLKPSFYYITFLKTRKNFSIKAF